MYSRWYECAVVMLWLTALGWLVVAKVLPPLLVGQPPDSRAILAAQRTEPVVGWRLEFDGQGVGWALCTTVSRPDRVAEIRSHVHFDRLPLAGILPDWLRKPLKLGREQLAVLNMKMDVRSGLIVDPLEGLERFESVVRLDALEDAIVLRGRIDGTELRLDVQSGALRHETRAYLPPDAVLGDALSPQTHLPGLRRGQTWTVPSYNPLRPDSPLEILVATVERKEAILWGGQYEETWLVAYRGDPGVTLGNNRTPRSRLWVRRDGIVLRQQVMIFDAGMVFERLPDEEAARLAQRVGMRDDVRGWPK